jgi:hypothetical protein
VKEWLLPLGALVWVVPASSHAADLDDTDAALRKAEEEIRNLPAQYIGAGADRSAEEQARALQQGEFYFLIKDYLRASILLLDFVDTPANRSNPKYSTSLYYLAESLYLNGNPLAARPYFEELSNRTDTDLRRDAVLRLLEMALATGNASEIETSLKDADAISAPSPALSYVIGKANFFLGRYDEATAAFSRIPPKDPNELPAAYYLGVVRVAQAKTILDAARAVDPAAAVPDDAKKILEDAKGLFRRALSIKAPEGQGEILWLCHMALGSIHHEVGEPNDAAKEYLSVPTSSESYGASRYQVAWVFISQNDLARAYTTLETMKVVVGEGPIVSEVQILEGSILLKLKRYPEALSAYETLRDTFTPIRDQLQLAIASTQDIQGYFRTRLEAKTIQEARDLMPPLARPWVAPPDIAARALTIQDDLGLIDANIAECDEIAVLLEGKLRGKSRIETFPTLNEGRQRGLGLSTTLAGLRNKAVSALAEALLTSATPEEKLRLDEISAKQRDTESLFKTLPKDREGYKDREVDAEKNFRDLEKRAHKLSLAVDGLSARLIALEKYYEDTKLTRALSTEEEEKLVSEISAKRAEIRDLQKLLGELEAELERERLQIGTNDDAFEQEETIRTYYQSLLQEEEAVLSKIAARTTKTPTVNKAQDILSRVNRSDESLGKFFSDLQATADARLESKLREVLTEKAKLVGYRDQAVALRTEAIEVTSQVLYFSLIQISKDMEDLVLRSNVGIIDVAWEMKEQAGEEFIKVREQKESDLDALHKIFDEALKEP